MRARTGGPHVRRSFGTIRWVSSVVVAVAAATHLSAIGGLDAITNRTEVKANRTAPGVPAAPGVGALTLALSSESAWRPLEKIATTEGAVPVSPSAPAPTPAASGSSSISVPALPTTTEVPPPPTSRAISPPPAPTTNLVPATTALPSTAPVPTTGSVPPTVPNTSLLTTTTATTATSATVVATTNARPVLTLPVPANVDPDAEATLIGMINGLRGQMGVAPLQVDLSLRRSARSWAVEMSSTGLLDHQDLGPLLSDWHLVAENIAHGPRLDRIFQALVASPSHFANFINPTFVSVGVGVAKGSDGRMWTSQLFGG